MHLYHAKAGRVVLTKASFVTYLDEFGIALDSEVHKPATNLNAFVVDEFGPGAAQKLQGKSLARSFLPITGLVFSPQVLFQNRAEFRLFGTEIFLVESSATTHLSSGDDYGR